MRATTAYLLHNKKAKIPAANPNWKNEAIMIAQRTVILIQRPISEKNRKPHSFNSSTIVNTKIIKPTKIAVNILNPLLGHIIVPSCSFSNPNQLNFPIFLNNLKFLKIYMSNRFIVTSSDLFNTCLFSPTKIG